MAGSISWNNFMEDVVKLQQHSNCISDSWQLISSTADPAQSYLCKKFQKLYRLPAVSTTTMLPSDEQGIGWKIGDDDQSVGNCSAMTTTWSHGDNKHIAQLCSCEYHVVYSASYGVPVAYFNLCRTNGCLLSLEEVWSLLPEEAARHDKWTFVTQQEHPVLARPFFQLHPCHTAAFMSRTWMGDTLANPVCPFCGQMLLLTVQIYCPLGGSAYHRTLYIFCCITPTCWNKSESWKVIRTQTIDTEVEAVSTSAKASVADQWCLSEDDWGDEEDGVMSTNNLVAKEDDLGDTGSGSSELNEQTCNRCVPNAATVAEDVIGSGDRCSSSSEPSQEVLGALHAMTVSDTASLSSAEIDAETTDNVIAEELPLSANAAWREVAEVVTREEGVRFGAFYISAFEEGTPVQPDTAHITHLLVAYEKQEGNHFRQLLASASSGSCGKGKAGSEGYEKGSARHGDQVFQSFHKKIQACPQQCLRYCIGGKPLHIRCIKKEQQIIPPCKSCGSPRQYEMQLMPTLVSILKLSNQEVKSGSAVEFGTILIYTCQNSCWKDGDVSHEEYVILEADPDQEQFQ